MDNQTSQRQLRRTPIALYTAILGIVIVVSCVISTLVIISQVQPPTPDNQSTLINPSGSNLNSSSTLEQVKKRGTLKCGVNDSLPGFGAIDDNGDLVGFDVDFCKALAAAVLGDTDAVEYIALNPSTRFPAIQSGDIDVLIRNTTWTFTRDTHLGLDFTVTTFYDGQGFMVREGEISSLEELNGATICVTSETISETYLADAFAHRGLQYLTNAFDGIRDTFVGFVNRECDAITADKSQLAALRSTSNNPDAYTILPDTISEEPMGPVVRANDSEWMDMVTWTVFAMIEAERLDINQQNVDNFRDSDNIAVQLLLGGGDTELGVYLGLSKDWAYQIIKQVGNYGDVYERHLENLGIPRAGSANAHWTEGGLIYAPTFR